MVKRFGIIGWWKSRKRITKIILSLFIPFLLWFWFSLPEPLFEEPVSYVVEDRKGQLLAASVAGDGQWRFPQEEEVPQKFVECVTTFEDKRFFSHPGIDPLAMGRALKQNISKRRRVSGASTLSMQVIRLSRRSKRNIGQKIIEALMAIRLEIRYSKKEILALYAAHAPFGTNVVGLEAAAWRYYGRPPAALSWGEMAALTVLPNAPSLVHPGRNTQQLYRKRNALLDKLHRSGKIDATTCALARLEPLPSSPRPLPRLAPHLLNRYRKERRDDEKARLRSTIDAGLQQHVNQILEQHHRRLKGNGINNLAAIVLEVESGDVLAYAGNVYHPQEPELQSHVDMIPAPRSPGSTLKPLLYAAALSEGIILPHSLLPDIPTQIGSYSPQNFDPDFDGAVPAHLALARSLNVPAVRLLRDYKYHRFHDLLKRSGFTTLTHSADRYGLSLILGGAEVTMWDLAGAYASMARTLRGQELNEGKLDAETFHPANYRFGKSMQSSPAGEAPGYNIPSIWYMFQAMQDLMRPGEKGLWEQFGSSQPIAWKTGTSFGFRDGWAIGVTSSHVVAVWAGNADGEGRPGLTGIRTAAPVLFEVFRSLPPAAPFAPPVSQYSFATICAKSGYLAGVDCDVTDTLMVPVKGSRSLTCAYHKKIHLDDQARLQVTDRCLPVSKMVHRSWFVLPPVMEWYYKRHHQDYASLPAFAEGCAQAEEKALDIIYPEAGSVITIPFEIDGARGQSVFTATHRNPSAKLFWQIDGQFIASTNKFHQVAVDPAPGDHLLTITDDKGEIVSRRFVIAAK